MNLPPKVIDGAIRVSFARYSTEDEAEYFVTSLKEAADTLRRSVR
jgi:cysteine sulfinate desulfinase/cysteine desulfurase-like protein